MSVRVTNASSRASTGVFTFVTVLLVLVPLPFGSVRTGAWAFWVAATALVAIAFVLGGGRRVGAPPAWNAALQIVLILALICQLLPVGLVYPILFDLAGIKIASTFLTLSPTATFLTMLRVAGYGLFFLLVLRVSANPRRAVLLLHLGFGLVVAYAALGMLLLVQGGDTSLGSPKWVYQGYATGPFVNHNSFASMLGMGLSVGLASMFAIVASEHPLAQKLIWSVLTALCLVLVAAALLATGSRMGAVAGLIGCIVVALLGVRRLGRIWVWITLLAAFFSCAALLSLGVGDGLLTRAFGIDISLDSRWALYKEVWEAILKRPLFGYGGGSFYWSFAPLARPPLLADVEWTKAHSTVLQWWFELGLVAGSIPLFLYFCTLLGALRRSLLSDAWYLNIAATGAMITSGLHSLIDFPLEVPSNAYFLIALIGVSMADHTGNMTNKKWR